MSHLSRLGQGKGKHQNRKPHTWKGTRHPFNRYIKESVGKTQRLLDDEFSEGGLDR